MTDHLAALDVRQVHAWYTRLADMIGRQTVPDGNSRQTPLAAIFLRRYLAARPNDVLEFTAPGYLRNAPQVRDALVYHRDVFLTRQQASFGPGQRRWVGVLPRLRGQAPYARWTPGSQLRMHYHSLVEIGGTLREIFRIQRSGTPQERDLFTALRGFQLQSDVALSGQQNQNSVRITFTSWNVHAFDRYDFDYSERLTLPNPDHGSTAPGAVRPEDRTLTVYHSNARRMVRAGLAAPYDLRSQPWAQQHQDLLAPADVTP